MVMEEPRRYTELPCPRSEWKTYGNYRVFCNGFIVLHPVRPWWWALEIYTLIGIALFAFEFDRYVVWQLCIGFILGGISIVASYKTLFCDPGICPRPSYDEALENYNKLKTEPKAHRKRVMYSRNTDVEVSYCFRCNMYRPSGHVGHCGVCDCCIKGWDHHCPVFGGCVGYKNKFWFYWMVFSIPAFWMFMLIVSMSVTLASQEPSDRWFHNWTLCCTLAGFLGAGILPPLMTCACCNGVHYNEHRGSLRLPPPPLNTAHLLYPRQPKPNECPDKKTDAAVAGTSESKDDRVNKNDTTISVEA